MNQNNLKSTELRNLYLCIVKNLRQNRIYVIFLWATPDLHVKFIL